MSLFAELRRRNVIRVGVLYVVAAWLVLQVADVLFGVLGLPDWSLRLVFAMLALGLPLVLIFSWIYELTPEGIKRDNLVDRSESITRDTGRKLNIATAILVIVAVAIVAVDRLMPAPGGSEQSVLRTQESSEQASPADTAAPETEAPAPPAPEPPVPAVDPRSVAVLPFVNMSGDPDNEYFSDGLSEELLNTLAGIPGLYVAARTSSFHFKGHTGDIAEIAKKLRVANVLEGSVRKAGDQVRITAQLIEAGNGYHLWSETYDRTLDDVFAVQDSIARSVGEALKVALLDEQAPARDKPTDSTEAYLAYLRGKQAINIGGGEGYREAIAHFEEAIRLDPAFRQAYAQLGSAWARLSSWGIISHAEGADAISEVIDRADARGSSDAAFLYLKGMERWARSFAGAEGLDYLTPLRQAAEQAPEEVSIQLAYAAVLGGTGETEQQIQLLRKVVDRDPLSVRAHAQLGYALEASDRFDEAESHARTIMEISPDSPEGPDVMANVTSRQGRFGDTIRWLAEVARLDADDAWSRAWMSWEYAAMDDLDRARAWADAAVVIDPRSPLTIQAQVLVPYRQGDLEAAGRLAWAALERGVDRRGGALGQILRVASNAAVRAGNPERYIRLVEDWWPDIANPDVPAEDLRQRWNRALLVPVLAQAGREPEARSLAQDLLQTSADKMPPILVAGLKGFLGDAAAAAAAIVSDRPRSTWAFEWTLFEDIAWDGIRGTDEARAAKSAWEARAASQLEALRASGEEPPLP